MDLQIPPRIWLIGAGGNGSKMLIGLKNIHCSLLALGYRGLEVTLFDPDTISESNLVRQVFYPADLGKNKAQVLIERLNMYYGLQWQAMPMTFSEGKKLLARHYSSWSYLPKLIISCVDNKKTRLEIARLMHSAPYIWWMDLGNDRYSGQVVLGNRKKNIPNVAQLFEAALKGEEDSSASCSVLEALQSQDLFVNDMTAAVALNMLWQLLQGQLSFYAAQLNLQTGFVMPVLPQEPNPKRTKRNPANNPNPKGIKTPLGLKGEA